MSVIWWLVVAYREAFTWNRTPMQYRGDYLYHPARMVESAVVLYYIVSADGPESLFLWSVGWFLYDRLYQYLRHGRVWVRPHPYKFGPVRVPWSNWYAVAAVLTTGVLFHFEKVPFLLVVFANEYKVFTLLELAFTFL